MLPGRVTYVVDKEGKIIMILIVCWLLKHIPKALEVVKNLTLRKQITVVINYRTQKAVSLKIDKYEYVSITV
jgi:hypothetical protein